MASVPNQYAIFNAESTKNLVYVIKITGVPTVFTTVSPSTRIIFGDPAVKFGIPGYVFGGLRPYNDANGNPLFMNLLDLDGSSLALNQRIEPESGKSTVSTITLSFVDKDGYMTKVCSPGVIIPEILGAEVLLYIGFAQTSYPQDFIRVFRGYVSQADIQAGRCTLQVSDANLKRRQQVFFCAQTTVASPVLATDTTIHVTSTNGFFFPILNASSGTDPAVITYVQINSEWIRTELSGNTTFGPYMDPTNPPFTLPMVRGARGSTAATAAAGDTVTAAVQLTDDPMLMALKIMLSGWNGPWASGVSINSVGPSPDSSPFITSTNYVVLPSGVDSVQDYGQVIGDWISIQGSPNNPTTGYYQITGFADQDGQSNRQVIVNATLIKDATAGMTISFRSQFDSYPTECGLAMTPKDVDVQGHLDLRSTFLGNAPGLLTFLITAPVDSGKQFIEEQIYRPLGCYSLTKRGLLSVGITLPPLAGSSLQILDQTNVLNAPDLKVSRVVNSRYFYNQIDYQLDLDDNGDYLTTDSLIDATTFNNIGYASTLQIQSDGLRTARTQPGTTPPSLVPHFEKNSNQTFTDAGIYVTRSQKNFLSRFKTAAAPIMTKVSWQVGSLIEAGDVVQINDGGVLQLANFTNGTRNFGSQLLFVTERTLDLKSGNATLQLVATFNTQLTDRFAVISPSSILSSASTSSAIVITDSFGSKFGLGNEDEKWAGLIGMTVLVHSTDFSVSGTAVFTGFDPLNPYRMLLSPSLGFTPAAGTIVELENYSEVSATDQQAAKTIYAYLDPMVLVVSGVDASNFTVSGAKIGNFFAGCPVRIHSLDFTTDSGLTTDYFVKAIDLGTNKITLTTPLAFTPSTGYQVDLIGFTDGGGPYRMI